MKITKHRRNSKRKLAIASILLLVCKWHCFASCCRGPLGGIWHDMQLRHLSKLITDSSQQFTNVESTTTEPRHEVNSSVTKLLSTHHIFKWTNNIAITCIINICFQLKDPEVEEMNWPHSLYYMNHPMLNHLPASMGHAKTQTSLPPATQATNEQLHGRLRCTKSGNARKCRWEFKQLMSGLELLDM